VRRRDGPSFIYTDDLIRPSPSLDLTDIAQSEIFAQRPEIVEYAPCPPQGIPDKRDHSDGQPVKLAQREKTRHEQLEDDDSP